MRLRKMFSLRPRSWRSRFCGCVLMTATAFTAAQSYGPPSPLWTTPLAPFRITDNIYYVGSRDLASYLIVTPAGEFVFLELNPNGQWLWLELALGLPLVTSMADLLTTHLTSPGPPVEVRKDGRREVAHAS